MSDEMQGQQWMVNMVSVVGCGVSRVRQTDSELFAVCLSLANLFD
jgi:hypothetical protein